LGGDVMWTEDELKRQAARLIITKDKRIEELEKDLMQAIEALEIIAGRKQCFDNTMSNVEIAKKALAGDNDE
jgi:hypothetical protein